MSAGRHKTPRSFRAYGADRKTEGGPEGRPDHAPHQINLASFSKICLAGSISRR
jgi:hypothetical protein